MNQRWMQQSIAGSNPESGNRSMRQFKRMARRQASTCALADPGTGTGPPRLQTGNASGHDAVSIEVDQINCLAHESGVDARTVEQQHCLCGLERRRQHQATQS